MHKLKYVRHVCGLGTMDGSLVESKPVKLCKMAVIDVRSENLVGS
jgi:hypothetical protein